MESLKYMLAVSAVSGFTVYATNALGFHETSVDVAIGAAIGLVLILIGDIYTSERDYEPFE
jgi:hypothetical protein